MSGVRVEIIVERTGCKVVVSDLSRRQSTGEIPVEEALVLARRIDVYRDDDRVSMHRGLVADLAKVRNALATAIPKQAEEMADWHRQLAAIQGQLGHE